MESVTQLLNGLDAGGTGGDELLSTIYLELRRMAAAKMANEPAGHTLQATALVNEVWIKLSAVDHDGWKNVSVHRSKNARG